MKLDERFIEEKKQKKSSVIWVILCFIEFIVILTISVYLCVFAKKMIPDEVERISIVDISSSSVALNWEPAKNGTGYVIEVLDGEEWVKIAQIDSVEKTDYIIENLHEETIYSFRICTYSYGINNITLFSTYTDISGATLVATKPSEVTNFWCDSASVDSITLKWDKVSNAEGYIVERYDIEKWNRIARIADNKETTLEVTGLNSGTIYKFRIRTFAFNGKDSMYSELTNIECVTDTEEDSRVD